VRLLFCHAPPQHLLLATGAERMLRRWAPWADLQCPLLCSFSPLPHHFILPLSASQTSIFPRYLAYSKSSSQTYLPHCHFNKLASYTCSSNLFIWPPQILPFSTALSPPPSSVMLALNAGTVIAAPAPTGVSTISSHPVPFCLSLVGLTLFSALLLLVLGVTLGKSLLQDAVEAKSPHGFTEQQLD